MIAGRIILEACMSSSNITMTQFKLQPVSLIQAGNKNSRKNSQHMKSNHHTQYHFFL